MRVLASCLGVFMWNLTIAGTDLYHIINWFFIYSFLGWAWESAYVSVKEHRFVNRGFVTGPLCTIYGCGAVAVRLLVFRAVLDAVRVRRAIRPRRRLRRRGAE